MAHRERNPFLGWRGIRVLLDKPDLLRPQIRAVLRASAHGSCRILLPMVTLEEEVEQFMGFLNEVKAELDARGVPYDDSVPIGIMVEVPAVAFKAERFAKMVDFFSIGTNDLTQYMLAVDRGNDLVSDRYRELDPAMLGLIKHIVDAAHRQGIPVSLCGELASNPRATPVLVGLGIDELSASPSFLPDIKRVIRSMKLTEAECIAEQILDVRGDQVIPILDRWLNDHHCGLLELMDHEVFAQVPTEITTAGSPHV
jgi:phosphotransferase system enzyme I (PtsI)